MVSDPRYFDREQADKLKELALEKTDGARQFKRAYKALTKIEAADKTVHKEHRKYEGAVAENELGKKRADVGLANLIISLDFSLEAVGSKCFQLLGRRLSFGTTRFSLSLIVEKHIEFSRFDNA